MTSQKDPSYKLIYKATTDGFTSKAFYAAVQEFEPILVLIKSQTNFIFGGYTRISYILPFESELIPHRDCHSKVFSLTNRKIFPYPKGSKKPSTYTLKGHIAKFMTWNISDGCDQKCQSKVYKNGSFLIKNPEVLAGTAKPFTVKEIEVYHVVPS